MKARTKKHPSTRLATPFPSYQRISERLADGASEPPDGRELESPRTESYGELWRRATARRSIRR